MRLANSVLPLLLGLAALAAGAQQADPASDAPEQRFTAPTAVPPPASYRDALARWRTPEDLNAWIGAHFQYDMARALQLSETQRARNGRMPILAPDAFFAQPAGVCVDLSRFAVETLRTTAPQTRPAYLMIEFDPVAIQGQTLRRHWLAAFQREGKLWFFADSKRPGHLAGPYEAAEDFVRDYAHYRGRSIVAHRLTDTYERRTRTQARRQAAQPAP
jgi:hypothetical protein